MQCHQTENKKTHGTEKTKEKCILKEVILQEKMMFTKRFCEAILRSLMFVVSRRRIEKKSSYGDVLGVCAPELDLK